MITEVTSYLRNMIEEFLTCGVLDWMRRNGMKTTEYSVVFTKRNNAEILFCFSVRWE